MDVGSSVGEAIPSAKPLLEMTENIEEAASRSLVADLRSEPADTNMTAPELKNGVVSLEEEWAARAAAAG